MPRAALCWHRPQMQGSRSSTLQVEQYAVCTGRPCTSSLEMQSLELSLTWVMVSCV